MTSSRSTSRSALDGAGREGRRRARAIQIELGAGPGAARARQRLFTARARARQGLRPSTRSRPTTSARTSAARRVFNDRDRRSSRSAFLPEPSTTSSRRTSARSTRWSRSRPTSTRSSRNPLKEQRRDGARRAARRQKLNVANPIDVPPTLVEQQCKHDGAGGRRAGAPHGPALHARAGAGAPRADPRRRRAKKVRAGLCSWPRSRGSNEFKVTDEDIEKGIQVELAEQTGKNVAKVKASSTARRPASVTCSSR